MTMWHNDDGKCIFRPGDIVVCTSPISASWGPAEVIVARSGSFGLGLKFLHENFVIGHDLAGRLTGNDANEGWWGSENDVEYYGKSEGLDDKQRTDFNNLLTF